MADTFTYTPFAEEAAPSIAQLNTLFSAIAAAVDAKLDVRDGVLMGDVSGVVRILNVLPDSEIDSL